jgi:hypothetical protein
VAVSRIAFALGDLRAEIAGLLSEDLRTSPLVDVCMAPMVYDRVVSELQHFHGGKLQKDARYRGPGTAVRYASMRLISVPPGNRNG